MPYVIFSMRPSSKYVNFSPAPRTVCLANSRCYEMMEVRKDKGKEEKKDREEGK